MTRTSLSFGVAIYKVLCDALGKSVTKVFPVVTDEANLPYVCYHRDAIGTTPTKSATAFAADVANVTIDCYAATYGESVALAENVRAALDNTRGNVNGVEIRGCYMVDASESWADDAFVQSLTFQLRC